MSAKTIITLASLAAIPGVLAYGITAKHSDLQVGTGASKAIANRFAVYDAAAHDSSAKVHDYRTNQIQKPHAMKKLDRKVATAEMTAH